MKQMNGVLLTAILAMGIAASATPGPGAGQQSTVKLDPPVIRMGTFYGGAKVRVEGQVPSGSKVVIVVLGPEVTEVFNKIGRVGPIWVNTGKVTISKVPSLLLVFSSDPLGNCLCRREIDRCQCDTLALKKRIHIEPQDKAEDSVSEDFLKLKVRQGNYQMTGGGVRTGAREQALADNASLALAREADPTPAPEGASMPYWLEFPWPKTVATGTYIVRVHVCRAGEVTESLEAPLQVIEAGFPAVISSLSRERPATYGIISVIVAMLAGFGIDFVASRLFKRRISSH